MAARSRAEEGEPARAHGIALHWRELALLLMFADALIVLAAMAATVRAWDALRIDFTPTEFFEVWFVATWLLWLVALRTSGAYEFTSPRQGLGHAGALARALAIVVALTLVAYFFVPRAFPRSTSLVEPPVVSGALLVWRAVVVTRLPRWSALERRVVLLGIDETTRRLAAMLSRHDRAVPYVAAAFLSDRAEAPKAISGVSVIAGSERLWDHVRSVGAEEIAVSRGEVLPPATLERLVECFQAGVAVVDAAQLYEELSGRVVLADLGSQWYAALASLPRRPYFPLKRGLDVVGAAAGLLVLSPLLLLLALAVVAADGRPVLYTQTRLGRRGELFTIHKLRSMRRDAEEDGPRYAEREDPRSTWLGRFLRPSGLDELPQLLDVLRGRMSLIGPRPERPELARELARQLPLYGGRLLVRPGIVGWAELHVPHATTLEQHLERLEYDLYYVKRASLLLDLDIGLRALGLVLRGRR